MGERRSYKEWSVAARGPTIKALLERAGLFLVKEELRYEKNIRRYVGS